MNILATTQLHIAFTIIVWIIAIVFILALAFTVLIIIGGTMLAISKSKEHRRKK